MADQMQLPMGNAKSEKRVLYFDLETLRSAGEVGGWGFIEKMGMACGVCFDTRDEKYHVYDEPDVEKLISHLSSADLVIGFNHVKFDYKVLSAYSNVNLRLRPNFDMLVDIESLLGFRLPLQALAMATLGEAKSADGLQSLKWVKEGRMDLVREYCQRDVEVTKRVFEFGATEGRVFYEKAGKKMEIPVRWKVDELTSSRRQ